MNNITLIPLVLALFAFSSIQRQPVKTKIFKEKEVQNKIDTFFISLNDSRTSSSEPSRSSFYIDTIITSNDNIYPLIDSILNLDKNHRSPNAEFCSHILDIRIEYFDKETNEASIARFNSCYQNGQTFKIANLLSERVFNIPQDFISPPTKKRP